MKSFDFSRDMMDNPMALGQAAANLVEQADNLADSADEIRDKDSLPEPYRCAAAQHRTMQANVKVQMAKVFGLLFLGSVIAQAFLSWQVKPEPGEVSILDE